MAFVQHVSLCPFSELSLTWSSSLTCLLSPDSHGEILPDQTVICSNGLVGENALLAFLELITNALVMREFRLIRSYDAHVH
jgi:hypothetical protein